jgi:hypothetical protein
MTTAHIRPHNGTPALFLDGQPVFAGMHWLSAGLAPDGVGHGNEDAIRAFAAAGLHISAVGMGAEWCGPRPGQPDHFDFSGLGPQLRAITALDPDARFHLRIYLETGPWWNALYPDECEVASDGSRLNASYASDVWHAHCIEYLRRTVAHLREIGMYDRTIAYQVCPGICGEWVKNTTSMTPLTGDYSAPMRRRFRAWLRAKYATDEALQAAWRDPDVTLDTAEVASNAELLETRHMSLRDPSTERKAIDYQQSLADLVAERLIDQCRAVKALTGGDKLAGAFYGYIMDQAWNDNYFGGAVDGSYATIQRSGHLGLRAVLRAPEVDFLVSPYGYAFRGRGGDGLARTASESARLHGKLYLYEEDSRLHNLFDHNGRNYRLEHSVAIHQRCFDYALTHGFAIWWLADWPAGTYSRHPEQEPSAFNPWLERFARLGRFNMHLDNAPCAEVAVLIDDDSLWHESMRNDLNRAGVFYQRVFGLPRFGAPHDIYLLDDLLAGRLPPYKLYIFLNAWHLDDGRRAALRRQLAANRATAVWVYGAGYLNEQPDLANMTDLNGITFDMTDHPWATQLHVTDFDHPITRGLPQDLFWGTHSSLGPVFHAKDPGARTLGQVVTALGRCKPGFVIKDMDGWTSIWLAAPGIPAPVLRGIARHAGVHLFNAQGDVLHASRSLLGVHTTSGGPRTFSLPRRVEVVFDLYGDRELARDTSEFGVELAPAASALYYFGDEADLRRHLLMLPA